MWHAMHYARHCRAARCHRLPLRLLPPITFIELEQVGALHAHNLACSQLKGVARECRGMGECASVLHAYKASPKNAGFVQRVAWQQQQG